MKIEDIGKIINDFLSQEDDYSAVLIDGGWGCGKTTQVRKNIDEYNNKDIIYVSLFGVKNISDLSACYDNLGIKIGKTIGNAVAGGVSAVPVVGSAISSALSNVINQFGDGKKVKKDKIFIFDDLERVDSGMSLIPLLGFFNTLMLKNCKVLCLSALDEIKDSKKREEFDRFTEKAFDRVYHIDEKPVDIFKRIFDNTNVTNIDYIIDTFDGNIRLAKRASHLFKNALSKVELIKDKEHDFFQNYSKEELLYSSVMAIKILYLNNDNCVVAEKDEEKFLYFSLKEYSEYFGQKISNRYIAEYINKKSNVFGSVHREFCLTRDLLHLEMFNNIDYLKEDSHIIDMENDSGNNSLLNTLFYYLNDKDRKKYVSLVKKGVRDKQIKIDSKLITMIGGICAYSELYIPNYVTKIIIDTVFEQVNNGNISTYEKIYEQCGFVSSNTRNDSNTMSFMYKSIKNKLEEYKKNKIETELLEAYRNKNYSYLVDFYYELTEGKNFGEREKYKTITMENSYFLPRLEKSIDYSMWTYCHQIAKYCRLVGIEKELIEFLKKYVSKYPHEESLKNKAHAMIVYNIDSKFKKDDLIV